MFRNLTYTASAAAGLALTSLPAMAQDGGIDQKVNEMFANSTGWFVSFIFSPFPGTSFPWIVAWLVIAATVFTLYFVFIQFRAFGHSISLVKGDYSDPNDAGEVSHFQALATALSGTVGLGNIAGVAVAVGIGGPGATFWMILAGLMGMASKFTECTLGVKYRNEYEDGTVSGGPMYYMTKGFAERGIPGGKDPGGSVLDLLYPRRLWVAATCSRPTRRTQQIARQSFGDYPGLDHRSWCLRSWSLP